jgi:hypothetical protein
MCEVGFAPPYTLNEGLARQLISNFSATELL